MSPMSVRSRRWAASLRVTLLASLLVASACDQVKDAVKESSLISGPKDTPWKRDSTLLAGRPSILLRAVDTDKGRGVAPIAVIGSRGFRRLYMSPRGWRAFDLAYFTTGSQIKTLHDGQATSEIMITRSMWDAGSQLDSLPGCPILIPAALAPVPAGVELLVAGDRPKLNPVGALSAGELQEALARIPTLIAPSSGIGTSMLSRYQRTVHVAATGSTPRPSIVVVYNDPQEVSDTLPPMGERPRQFVVVLDHGVYGYRPTFTFTTLGNALSPPRLRFLDFVDVDADGKAELFFTHLRSKKYPMTKMLRYEAEAWREELDQLVRCQV